MNTNIFGLNKKGEHEYEYIWVDKKRLNTNTNMNIWTGIRVYEYKYEYSSHTDLHWKKVSISSCFMIKVGYTEPER